MMLKISLSLETGYNKLSFSLDLQAKQVRSLHRSSVRAGAGGIFVVRNT